MNPNSGWVRVQFRRILKRSVGNPLGGALFEALAQKNWRPGLVVQTSVVVSMNESWPVITCDDTHKALLYTESVPATLAKMQQKRNATSPCFFSYNYCHQSFLYPLGTALALHSFAISSYLQNSTPSLSFNHKIILSTIPSTCAIPLQSGCNIKGNKKSPSWSVSPDPFSHSHSKRSFHICSMRRTST